MNVGCRIGSALAALVFVSTSVAPVSVAFAAPPAKKEEPSGAAALKTQADRAMDDLRYGEALDAYRRAYELSGDPALLYNQARASQALGELVAALDLIERFEKDAPAALKARVPDLAGLEADLRSRTSSLTVTSAVPGAELLLRGVVIGKTPFAKPIRTTAGHAALVVRAEGYEPFEKEIDLPGGGELKVDAPLRAKDRRGVVIVRAVNGARVTFDGQVKGDVPVEVAALEGTHEIRVEADGYDPKTTAVITVAGQRKELDVELVKRPSILAKWWFWTAIGVVVAGGVATYFVVTTERKAEPGSINPGVVSGPLKIGALLF